MSREHSVVSATRESDAGPVSGSELREALEGSRVSVSRVDRELRYVWAVNPVGGYSHESLVGKTDYDLYGPAGEPLMALKGQALASGSELHAELCLPLGGEERFYELTIRPWHDDGGLVTSLRCKMIEITARRNAELELARLNADLEGRVAHVIGTDRFAANQRLATTVAHEVNTPLQAIESCLHLAGKLADEQQRARYLHLAREEIKRIGHMLRQLLDVYRPAQGTSSIALNDLVERVLLLVESSLARQRIAVECQLSPGLPPLRGRADELTQVLLNLVFNAAQAMTSGGRLTLRTSCEETDALGRRLVLTVRDSGPGIEADLLDRIFEPFFTTRPEGSGMGLAVSQSIIAAYGGTIMVESTPGAGTCFSVIFPLVHEGRSER